MLVCASNEALIPASKSSIEGFHNQLLAITMSSSHRTSTSEGRMAEEPPFLASPYRKEK
jgi:hypothetical protein